MRPDTPKGVPIEEFRRNLRVLEREMVRQLAEDTGCCGVTLAQCHALLELSSAELSLSALSSALDLDISTLSRTIERMVRCGFVTRAEDASDRRHVRLTLTPAGGRKVAAINEMCNRYYSALLEPLSESERRCVLRAVHLLADRMHTLRSPKGAVRRPVKKGSACGLPPGKKGA